MKKIFLLICVISIITEFQLLPQKTWTLEDCISYAIENNIDIKRQKLAYNIFENEFKQSKLNMLPSLNGGSNYRFNYGHTVDRFTNEFIENNVQSNDLYIQASMNLFKGFENQNQIKMNQFNLLAELENLNKLKNDITLLIATAYLQILFNEELLEVSTSQLEVTNLQVERAEKQVEVGNKAKGELLEILAIASNEKVNVASARNNLRLSYLNLMQLLDLKADTLKEFVIEIPGDIAIDAENVSISVNDIYNEAITIMPQVKGAEFKLKSSEKQLDIARWQQYPTLALSGTYYTGYSDARTIIDINNPGTRLIGYVENSNENVYSPTFGMKDYPYFDQLKDNASTSIEFRLAIPIFNGWQVQKNISNAKIGVLDTKYMLNQNKQYLYKDIEQAHADAKASLEKYYSSEEAVKSNEEAYNYTEQKFNVGLVSSVDFNIAKTNLLKAKSDYLQAKYEYIFKSKILDFYRGTPISL